MLNTKEDSVAKSTEKEIPVIQPGDTYPESPAEKSKRLQHEELMAKRKKEGKK